MALKRRAEKPDFTGEEAFNFFLSGLFPEDELKILPYNRVVSDLNGMSAEDLLLEADAAFCIRDCGSEAVQPENKGVIRKGRWCFATSRRWRITSA